MGDFPLMTEKGTFIYNGAERVIVTQLVRSPGPYFGEETDKSGTKLYSAQIIPNRGAWIEYETDSNEIISVRVDRTRKQPLTTLLRALGMGSDEEILRTFGPFITSERMRYTPARLAPLERGEPQKHVAFDFGFIDFVEKFMPCVIVFFDGEVFCAVFPVNRTH